MNGLNLKLILSVVDKMTAPVKKLTQTISASMKAAGKAVFEFGDRWEKAGKKMSEAGGFLTSRITAPLAGLGFLSLRTAGQTEQLVNSLVGVAGSADQARAELDRLNSWRKGTPFELADVVDAELALRNAGYSAEEAAQRMEMLGPVAARMKKPLNDVVSSFLDMRLNGKVGSSELLSMVKANVPIVAELGKALNKTDKQIYAMADNGKISFAQVRDAMSAMSAEGGVLAGDMARYATSINGRWKALTDKLSSALDRMGTKLWEKLQIGEKLSGLTDTVENLVNALLNLPAPVQSFIGSFLIGAAILGPLVVILGQIVTGIGVLAMGLGKLPIIILGVAQAVSFLGKALLFLAANPIGLAITAVVAFGVAGYMLVKHWSKVSAFFSNLWDGIKEAFGSAIDWIMGKVDALVGVVTGLISKLSAIKGAFTDNPVTRAWNNTFGSDETTAPSASGTQSLQPVGMVNGTQRVDTGGELRIRIDVDGRAKQVDGKPNDGRMGYSVDTGLMGAGF